MSEKKSYKLSELRLLNVTPIEQSGLPEGLIKEFKDLGYVSLQSVFGVSIALRVGEGLNAMAKPYGLTHEDIHKKVGMLLPIEEVVRLCGPIPIYSTGCLSRKKV